MGYILQIIKIVYKVDVIDTYSLTQLILMDWDRRYEDE